MGLFKRRSNDLFTIPEPGPAAAGDNVGLLLKGLARGEVAAGDVVRTG